LGEQIGIEDLWDAANFSPDANQRAAILHTNGPLFLPAGPGSGKTRVLLWKTVNLIVCKKVPPDQIFLSTFTEKASRQLRVGLTNLLSISSLLTGKMYDIGRMYLGTLHSLCQRLLMDKRLSYNLEYQNRIKLMDELDQYFYLSNNSTWRLLFHDLSLGESINEISRSINRLFGQTSYSKHVAVTNLIALFNRFSEELVDPYDAMSDHNDDVMNDLLISYSRYLSSLTENRKVPLTDFSILQQDAYKLLVNSAGADSIFSQVIIDEYQDTNSIQEKLIFQLAKSHKNLCVVGDDDQALYRFRGATVENFISFPKKCAEILGVVPTTIAINTNYRSAKGIVDFYSKFMTYCNWVDPINLGIRFRVEKELIPNRTKDGTTSVVVTNSDNDKAVCDEIASFVKKIISEKIVDDPNQIAFLFPSLKSEVVGSLQRALEMQDVKVYAPRANRFLNTEEAVAIFGIFSLIFGKLERGFFSGRDYDEFFGWLDFAHETASALIINDQALSVFVNNIRTEIENAVIDFEKLEKYVSEHGLSLGQTYTEEVEQLLLHNHDISNKTKQNLTSKYFRRIVTGEIHSAKKINVSYALTRATSLDWTLLDLFYQLLGFPYFSNMMHLAEKGMDEGPICNLALISGYISRFMELYFTVLSAQNLRFDKVQKSFFGSFLYSLFRIGETEYEDIDDPFPKGRVPFLTIHQSKGLEFPIVIFGNPRKTNRTPEMEKLIDPFISREREPLNSMGEHDNMRLFYVAMSRAKDLLIITRWNGARMGANQPLKDLIDSSDLPFVSEVDTKSLSKTVVENNKLTNTYSYTSDFLQYKRCARQYMIFKVFNFSPSRTQTQFFGKLVHQTIEDLHQFIMKQSLKNGN